MRHARELLRRTAITIVVILASSVSVMSQTPDATSLVGEWAGTWTLTSGDTSSAALSIKSVEGKNVKGTYHLAPSSRGRGRSANVGADIEFTGTLDGDTISISSPPATGVLKV